MAWCSSCLHRTRRSAPARTSTNGRRSARSASGRSGSAPGYRAFERLARLRQPTIALVDGIAYGGGLELALACDMRLASERARFAFPEVGVGTTPGWAGPQRATRLIGPARTKQLATTGEPIDAATALAWGW